MSDVAQVYGLGTDKSKQSDQALYKAKRATLSFKSKTRYIELDHVTHWLSAPVLTLDEKLWLPSKDVLNVIDPILRKGSANKHTAVRRVVIDPGHGGKDRGAIGARGRPEKELALDLARRVEQHLKKKRGITTILTRNSNRTLSLAERVQFNNKNGGDVFVSLHFNAGGSATGIETYSLPIAGTAPTAKGWKTPVKQQKMAGNQFDEQNAWLAHCVQGSLLTATSAKDRGVRRARFYVLKHATSPAILVEAGFLTNKTEEQKILTAAYRDTLAKAIADGISKYVDSVNNSKK